VEERNLMRIIDPETWPRREHFKIYSRFDYPHFNLTFPVDTSEFQPWVKARHDTFTLAAVYLLARVANEIPSFRLRIRGQDIVEHEVVHPSFTILLDNDLFSFCTVQYQRDYEDFQVAGGLRIEETRTNPTLEDEPGQDDLLFMTSLPWVHFTSMMHPIHMHPVDSVPRIAWGRIDHRGDQQVMPLSVQVHHALMDGLHVGRYAERVQYLLRNPQELV
jgi:chloramphenicol O-acetyltransferase type A